MPNIIKIDLWFWRLDDPAASVARWRSYLDRVEHARMARFMFARDQIRFTICRSRMRRILGWYTQCQPRDIAFATEGRDKPVLAGNVDINNPVQFNLSHTDGLACLAVTHNHAVGVDLERIRPIKDDFIAYSLNPAEQTLVLPLEHDQKQAAFFRIWTAKEAYLKAIGTGLWQSLKSFDVDVPFASDLGKFATGSLPRIDDTEQRNRDWRIYTFSVSNEHIGALALAVPDMSPGTPPDVPEIEIRTRWIGCTSFPSSSLG